MTSPSPIDPASLTVHDPLEREVLRSIRATGCIVPGSRVIVGLSGGPDSVSLLHILRAIAPSLSLRIEAAHLHHGLRGEDADEDEAFVRTLCGDLGVPLAVSREDVAALAAASGESIETAGRDARYAFLRSLALPDGATVAVAHHRDDQAETLLMNLCRGAGLEGLRGMRPRSGFLARPLLDFSRKDLLDYLDRTGRTFRIDPTNSESCTTRNRIRLEVLPLLASIFSTPVGGTIASAAGLLAQDAAYLEEAADTALTALGTSSDLDCDALQRLPPAISSRLVRRLYKEVRGDCRDLNHRSMQSVLALIASGKSNGSVSLPAGIEARIRHRRLSIARKEPPSEEETIRSEVHLDFPGTVVTSDGWRIAASLIENPHQMVYNSMEWCFHLDPSIGCTVRSRRTGDRIRPAGGSGSRSLKRLLIDRRVPRENRGALLVFAIGQEILWVPGIAVGAASADKTAGDREKTGEDHWVRIVLERIEGVGPRPQDQENRTGRPEWPSA